MTPCACIVIPVYNHGPQLLAALPSIETLGLPILLVDDGSGIETANMLAKYSQDNTRVSLVRLNVNQGKGRAVAIGLQYAKNKGFSHALQIDADGQHDLSKVPEMLAACQQTPDALIAGYPIYDASVNRLRYFARYLTHIWVWIETLSLDIRDSMCGFRIYPLCTIIPLLNTRGMGKRMDFDTEIMVRANWAGIPINWVAVGVIYPENGLSNFRPFTDNALISWMHTRLVIGMLWRLPTLVWRATCIRRIK